MFLTNYFIKIPLSHRPNWKDDERPRQEKLQKRQDRTKNQMTTNQKWDINRRQFTSPLPPSKKIPLFASIIVITLIIFSAVAATTVIFVTVRMLRGPPTLLFASYDGSLNTRGRNLTRVFGGEVARNCVRHNELRWTSWQQLATNKIDFNGWTGCLPGSWTQLPVVTIVGATKKGRLSEIYGGSTRSANAINGCVLILAWNILGGASD